LEQTSGSGGQEMHTEFWWRELLEYWGDGWLAWRWKKEVKVM